MPTELFVYHAVPAQMLGETLVPLRELEPAHYRRERAKYDDHPVRRRLPLRHIAKLNCVQQEVLHFAPVHPHRIYRAWQTLGVTLKPALWFGIPLSRLEGLPAVVTVENPSRKMAQDLTDDAVTWLEPATYRELTELPEATLRWYAQLIRDSRRGGWFVGVPHVLVRGRVPVSGLTPFDWSLPH